MRFIFEKGLMNENHFNGTKNWIKVWWLRIFMEIVMRKRYIQNKKTDLFVCELIFVFNGFPIPDRLVLGQASLISENKVLFLRHVKLGWGGECSWADQFCFTSCVGNKLLVIGIHSVFELS